MNDDGAWNRRPKESQIKEQTENCDTFERYEIIHGVRYDLQPSPNIVHQILVTELNHALRTTCHPEGIIVVAPMDVHLDENNTVQPDVIFIRNESMHIVKNQRIEGTPELLVEILSPSTGKHDRIRKKALYEAFRVQEYWIIDPVHYTIEQYVLVDGLLHLRAIFGEDNHINSDLLTCVHIDVGSLFEPARRFAE
jgi:Uma2 family endonuclease